MSIVKIPSASFSIIQMDADDLSSIESAVGRIFEGEDRLDVVVNNAGIALAAAVEDSDVIEAKALFEINFFGVLRVCRAVLPAMRRQGFGHIVNIGSLAGLAAVPFEGMYCTNWLPPRLRR
jgi:NADP-dependent 3-hydroxy acid dehydrogenase YdfG